jgi:hypothetical protein
MTTACIHASGDTWRVDSSKARNYRLLCLRRITLQMPEPSGPPNRKARRATEKARRKEAKTENGGDSRPSRGTEFTSKPTERSLPSIPEGPEALASSVASEGPANDTYVGKDSIDRMEAALAALRDQTQTRLVGNVLAAYSSAAILLEGFFAVNQEFDAAGVEMMNEEEAEILMEQAQKRWFELANATFPSCSSGQRLWQACSKKLKSGRDMARVVATSVRNSPTAVRKRVTSVNDSMASVRDGAIVSARDSIASTHDSVVSALNRVPLPTADSAYMRDSLLALRDSPTLRMIVGTGTVAGLSALGGNGENDQWVFEVAAASIAGASASMMLSDAVPPGSIGALERSVRSAMQSIANLSLGATAATGGYSPPSVFTEDAAEDTRSSKD